MSVSIERAAGELEQLAWARRSAENGDAKRLRVSRRLTQEEVANVCGVDASTVSKWEDGHRRPRGDPGRRYAALLAALAKEEGP